MSYAALIFSHSITPRLQYVVDFLSQYYGVPFRLTSAEEKYLQATETCRINYSYHRLGPGELFLHAHVLLTESYVRPVKIECFQHHGYCAFFRAEGDFGFDIFAGIFYLLTRYEEYLPHHTDAYGRFAHESSVAFREGFLNQPLINFWLEDLRKLLAEKNPVFEKRNHRFRFLPTYDIDMAWSFRNKGFKRNSGAMLQQLFRLRFRKMMQRVRVLRGRQPDPFDAYAWMDEQHRQLDLHPLYFFLMAPERSRYDRNIDVQHPEFRQLVHALAARYTIGLHPSWISGDHPYLLTKEKQLLEQVSGKKITDSRQHYIRFHLPETYQRLLTLGITHEYSMGYGSINGFRASVATPFYWYNLKRDEPTSLQVFPFCFMDANAWYEQKLSPEAAMEELMQLYQTIRSVDGYMITIWHNSFLGSDEEFRGWRDVYRQFLEQVTSGS